MNTYSYTNEWLSPHKLLLIFFYLIFFVCIWKWWIERNYPTTKTDFAKWYGIDKKTFNKWISHFCQKLYPEIKIYQRMRKLSKQDARAIINILGTPQFYPILTKKEIVDICDSSYGVLRRCVYAFPKSFELTPISFKVNQKFPPKIGRKIMQQFDPDRMELVLDKYPRFANGDDLTTSPKKS